jgi:hypothetical protein
MTGALIVRRPARLGMLGAAVGTVGLAAAVVATPAAGAAPATVNVVHGIPGVAVKVCVDGNAVADHFRYGNTIVGAALPATAHKVRLVRAGKSCRATAILESAYKLGAGRNYTIVANLNAAGTPNLAAFRTKLRPTVAGNARLTVRHTAQAPAVNVWAGAAKLIGGTEFTWGKSATLGVPAGSYAVKVTLPGSTTPVIGPASTTLAAGHAYQVYAVGSPGHYRLVTVDIPVGSR